MTQPLCLLKLLFQHIGRKKQTSVYQLQVFIRVCHQHTISQNETPALGGKQLTPVSDTGISLESPLISFICCRKTGYRCNDLLMHFKHAQKQRFIRQMQVCTERNLQIVLWTFTCLTEEHLSDQSSEPYIRQLACDSLSTQLMLLTAVSRVTSDQPVTSWSLEEAGVRDWIYCCERVTENKLLAKISQPFVHNAALSLSPPSHGCCAKQTHPNSYSHIKVQSVFNLLHQGRLFFTLGLSLLAFFFSTILEFSIYKQKCIFFFIFLLLGLQQKPSFIETKYYPCHSCGILIASHCTTTFLFGIFSTLM